MNGVPEKTIGSVNVSAPWNLVKTFREYALAKFGGGGISEAGRIAFEEFLGKRGVRVDGEPKVVEQQTLAKIQALRELGIDVDGLLERSLAEAGAQPEPAISAAAGA